jgi:hypothetical protein
MGLPTLPVLPEKGGPTGPMETQLFRYILATYMRQKGGPKMGDQGEPVRRVRVVPRRKPSEAPPEPSEAPKREPERKPAPRRKREKVPA